MKLTAISTKITSQWNFHAIRGVTGNFLVRSVGGGTLPPAPTRPPYATTCNTVILNVLGVIKARMLRGNCTLNQNACLLCSLKIINTFLENSMVTLKQRISNLNCTKILVGKAVLPLIKPCEILFWKELKNLLAYWILMPFLSSLENMLQLMLTLLFHKNVVNFEIVNNAYSKLVWGAVLP